MKILRGMEQWFCVLAICVGFGCLAMPSASAGYALNGQYWNGDLNYPHAYGHADAQEYVDLSSCTFVYNRPDEYEFAADVVTVGYDLSQRETYYFRQKKDGKSLPEFRGEGKNWQGSWQTLPSWKGISLNDEYSFGSYKVFTFRYMPVAHQVFIIAYEKMWGVMYSEL